MHSASPGAFIARVSIADVDASGQFSAFDAVDRIIVQLDGPAMRLTVEGVPVTLRRYEPFQFDGGTDTTCEIDSATRDLNVMTLRGFARATVSMQYDAARQHAVEPGQTVLVIALRDGTRVRLTKHGHGHGHASVADLLPTHAISDATTAQPPASDPSAVAQPRTGIEHRRKRGHANEPGALTWSTLSRLDCAIAAASESAPWLTKESAPGPTTVVVDGDAAVITVVNITAQDFTAPSVAAPDIAEFAAPDVAET